MGNVNELISVIIIAYKVADELSQCIESVINQSYKNLEIILVDDGSPDSVPEICDKYKIIDKRIQVIHKNNEGCVFARKEGLLKASGKYILMVDGDDYLDKGFIENMVNKAEMEHADIVVDSFFFSFTNKEIPYVIELPEGVYRNNALYEIKEKINYCSDKFHSLINPSLWNKLFLKEKLIIYYKNIPKEITLGEDFAVSFPYLIDSNCLVILNSDQYYHYRQRENSMVNAYDEKLVFKINKLIDYLSKQESLAKVSEQIDIYYFYLWVMIISNAAKSNGVFYSKNKLKTDYSEFLKKEIIEKTNLGSFKYRLLQYLTCKKQWLLLIILFKIHNKSY